MKARKHRVPFLLLLYLSMQTIMFSTRERIRSFRVMKTCPRMREERLKLRLLNLKMHTIKKEKKREKV